MRMVSVKAGVVFLSLLTGLITAWGGAAVYDPGVESGRYILTPPEPSAAQIQGPAVFGVRPGSPFLYSIAATGVRPMHFGADGLPAGLSVNENSGVISGTISDRTPRDYCVVLRAGNSAGAAEKKFKITVGDAICLTPPMGWNSWNCWGPHLNQARVLASAQAMVDKGLKNYGWTYINMDDGWQSLRGGKYNGIQADPERFPDIKKMCDEVHALGLKVGLYSAPWITTYAGHIGGSSENEEGAWNPTLGTQEARKSRKVWTVGRYTWDEQDAAQWAGWGIDYLKYDWYKNDPVSTVRMADALRACGRDIIYSLSNSADVEQAELYGRVANCWRTAGDLKDRWDQDGSHLSIRDEWKLHQAWLDQGIRGGPGHFPDADMLVVGEVNTSSSKDQMRPSGLTPDEQYSHVSLWTLWSCPLLIGCPIESMDQFTLKLLSNAEVLAIHQDSRAIPAESIVRTDEVEIFVKDLADGGKAIGLFNLSATVRVIDLDWTQAGLRGAQRIRDVWRQKEIGTFSGGFSAKIPSHGVILIRTQEK